MPYLIDAIQRKDEEYLKQLILEQKVHYVEKDVKVSRFGYSSDPNNELIVFNEGKFTNKTGVTLKKFLLTEEQYQEREKKLYDKSKDLIIKCFNETDNYEDIIQSEDYNYVNNFYDLCFNKKNILMKNLYDDNNDENIKMIFNDAGDILIARMDIVFYNLQSMKLNDKKRLKDNYYKKESDEIILKEKKLRKEFFNKYGF